MKSYKFFALLILVLAILSTSCKKDEAKVNSKNEILTAHPWKIFSSKENGISDLMDCEKDNVLTFYTNGTHTMISGSIKCDPQETTISGTWILSDDGIHLSIKENDDDGKPHEYTVTVIELMQSKLIVSLLDGNYTYEHIFVPL